MVHQVLRDAIPAICYRHGDKIFSTSLLASFSLHFPSPLGINNLLGHYSFFQSCFFPSLPSSFFVSVFFFSFNLSFSIFPSSLFVFAFFLLSIFIFPYFLLRIGILPSFNLFFFHLPFSLFVSAFFLPSLIVPSFPFVLMRPSFLLSLSFDIPSLPLFPLCQCPSFLTITTNSFTSASFCLLHP